MNQTKSIFESKTIWGVIVLLIAHFGPAMGISLDEVTQGAVSDELAVIAGSALAIYGRLTAKAPIDGAT